MPLTRWALALTAVLSVLLNAAAFEFVNHVYGIGGPFP